MNIDIIVSFICVAIFIIVFIIVIIFLWIFSNKDIEKFNKNISNINSSSVTDGNSGQNGLSALEIYNLQNNTNLTQSQFDALFEGSDGEDGIPGGNGVDGVDGIDGSTGFQGAFGDTGEKGIDGDIGETGVPGETFIVFTDTTNPAITAVDAADNTSNFTNYPDIVKHLYRQYTIFFSGDLSGYSTYFYEGKKLFNVVVKANPPPVSAQIEAYISIILYDQDYNVIGFTKPIKYRCRDDLTGNVIDIPYVSIDYPNFKFRIISSLNRGKTESSFTSDIFEKTLSDKSFSYSQANYNDAFVKKINNIISSSPGYLDYEKVNISETHDLAVNFGISFDVV